MEKWEEEERERRGRWERDGGERLEGVEEKSTEEKDEARVAIDDYQSSC